jgi:pimeloyl-ACP methyl ester carboxylesterase
MGLVPDGPTMRQRPTVVCLHGGPGPDHTMLKPFLAPLADTAQIIFIDQRGHGRSDPSSPDRWNLHTWVADVAEFCKVLEIEEPILLGQSFGGMVALGVAIRHPELPAKLVLSSSAARFRLDRALPMFERLGGKEAPLVAERFFHDPSRDNAIAYMATCLPLYNPTPGDPDAQARILLRPEVMAHYFRGEMHTYNWFGDLDRIRCPTLILAGELDPVTTIADHEEMAAGIRGSRLEIFQDAGHGVFRDKPDEALAVIRDFVRTDADEKEWPPRPTPSSCSALLRPRC